jgi:hypothetical protein
VSSAAKVFTFLPAFGQVNTSFTTASLVATTRFLEQRGAFGGFAQMSYPDLPTLRAMALTIWYDKIDASHILMVDSDMHFEPKLVLDMLDFDQPLVGCIYPKRTLPISWVGSSLEGEPEIKDGFMKMEGVGFGVTLIRRDCVVKIIERDLCEVDTDLSRDAAGKVLTEQGINRLIRAFDPVHLPKRKLSEDFSFCYRHRQAGGDVWAAINHKVTHIGDYGFGGRYADVLEQQSA